MTHHWENPDKARRRRLAIPRRCSPRSSLYAACLVLRVRYFSLFFSFQLVGLVICLSRLRRVDLYDARYGYSAVLSHQYAGFWRQAQTPSGASRVQERIAAAKMTRAVLLISVFTIFLDVLHAGQVSTKVLCNFLYLLFYKATWFGQ